MSISLFSSIVTYERWFGFLTLVLIVNFAFRCLARDHSRDQYSSPRVTPVIYSELCFSLPCNPIPEAILVLHKYFKTLDLWVCLKFACHFVPLPSSYLKLLCLLPNHGTHVLVCISLAAWFQSFTPSKTCHHHNCLAGGPVGLFFPLLIFCSIPLIFQTFIPSSKQVNFV